MGPSSEDAAFRRYQVMGDPAAVAEVFDALAPRLLLLAAHLSGGQSGAEDLLQSTFLAAIEHPDRWDGVRPVAGWLVGIMRHRAIDLSRKGGGAKPRALVDVWGHGPAPSESLERDEFFAAVERGVEGVDSPYREVLLLHLLHGLGPRAIAHSLGRSPSATRMQLKRGLERLRAVLPKEYAPVAAVFALHAKELAQVRSVVIQTVKPSVAALANAATPVLVGGLMMKWIVVTCSAVLMAVWMAFGSGREVLDTADPNGTGESLDELTQTQAVIVDVVKDRGRAQAPAAVALTAVPSSKAASSGPGSKDAAGEVEEPLKGAHLVHASGVVVDQEGAPVPLASVYSVDNSVPERRTFVTEADGAGRFEVAEIEQGKSLWDCGSNAMAHGVGGRGFVGSAYARM